MTSVKSNVLVDNLTIGRMTSALVDEGFDVIITSNVGDDEHVTVDMYWPCCKNCNFYKHHNHVFVACPCQRRIIMAMNLKSKGKIMIRN